VADADVIRRAEPEALMSVILTARSGSDAGASRPGSVMGTLGYMAREQARREILTPRGGQTDQSSSTSPGTRAKSRRFAVTKINWFAKAMDAILRSRLPIRTARTR